MSGKKDALFPSRLGMTHHKANNKTGKKNKQILLVGVALDNVNFASRVSNGYLIYLWNNLGTFALQFNPDKYAFFAN